MVAPGTKEAAREIVVYSFDLIFCGWRQDQDRASHTGAMRVATWNTFLAPGMADRPARLPLVLQTLTRLARNHQVDVLALQELHGYRCGTMTSRAAGWIQQWLPAWCARAVSERVRTILAIMSSWLEGLLCCCPSSRRAEPVLAPYRNAVLAHCRKLGWVHQHVPTPQGARAGAMDCGVVLVARAPLEARCSHALPGDAVHTPGAIGASVAGVRVWAVHLLPRLPWTRGEYYAVHALNALCGIDARARAEDNVRELARACLASTMHEPTIVMGDMNAPVAAVRAHWASLLPSLALLSTDDNTLCPCEPEAPLCIDHIWGSRVLLARRHRRDDDNNAMPRLDGVPPLATSLGSDHWPVMAMDLHALHDYSSMSAMLLSTEQVHPTAKINRQMDVKADDDDDDHDCSIDAGRRSAGDDLV